ncbi:MAG: ABC transporter permease [Bacillota bacterium]|nr:ABC transporter permease [Bacillota bacterium]
MRYLTHVFRRTGNALIVLVGLSIVIFLISRVLPGDPARMALGPYATEEQVRHLRSEMGLDRPLVVQYVRYVSNLLRGDFGKSLVSERNVRLDLEAHLPATAELIVVTTLWIVLLGIPLGALSAVKKDTWIDHAIKAFTFTAVVTPGFIVGIAFQLLFGYGLDWLPVTGRLSPGVLPPERVTGFLLVDSALARDWPLFRDALIHILLPSLALSFAGMGQTIRITRSSMLDVENRDFIQVVRSYGVPERLVMFKYMLKPAFIPTLQVIGLTFASLFGNAFLIENVFSWPGMAKYGVTALLKKDLNALIGVVLVIGTAFLVVNLVVDVLMGFLDPRLRLKGAAR